MPKDYEQLYDNDPFLHNLNESHRISCCDCGKVCDHRLKLVNENTIEWRIKKVYSVTNKVRNESNDLALKEGDIDHHLNQWVMIPKKEYKRLRRIEKNALNQRRNPTT